MEGSPPLSGPELDECNKIQAEGTDHIWENDSTNSKSDKTASKQRQPTTVLNSAFMKENLSHIYVFLGTGLNLI